MYTPARPSVHPELSRRRASGEAGAAPAWPMAVTSQCHAAMAVVSCLQPKANRMFFLSIPPNVFVAVAGGAADYCSSK